MTCQSFQSILILVPLHRSVFQRSGIPGWQVQEVGPRLTKASSMADYHCTLQQIFQYLPPKTAMHKDFRTKHDGEC